MQVPAVSLPALSGGFLGFFRRPWVLYGIYTFVLFLIFIVVTFPHDVLIRRGLEMVPQTSVVVSIDDARFAWWNGWEMQDLRLSSVPVNEGIPPLVEFNRFQVRPDWGSWLRGQLNSVALWGELYGGTADGSINYTAGEPPSVAGHLEWAGVELRRYRALTRWLDQGRLAGTLAGWVDGHQDAGNLPEGEGEVFLQHASIEGGKVMGFTVPDLSVDDAKSKFTLKGDRLDIQDVTLAGNELSIQISGFVSLRQPLGQSIPNLKVTIQKLPESLKPLVAVFAPQRAKTLPAQLQLTGTLARPQLK